MMVELNARLLDLPAHLRRVIQVEVLCNMPPYDCERALDTVHASCGLPNDSGVLIMTPRDLIFACRSSYGDHFRLLQFGRSKCKPVWKVLEYRPALRNFKATADGISRKETASILASQLTKKRGEITMAVLKGGKITKHRNYSTTVSDAPLFTVAAMRMLETVPPVRTCV